MGRANCRIAMYSHDAMGIGHVRRNLVVAEALGRAAPDCSILLISGVYETGAFAMPASVDCLALPSLRKLGDGLYEPRRLTTTAHRILALRGAAIRGALTAFEPHVLVVDKLPLGIGGELTDALCDLRRAGNTRCVLGLRDILDDPATVSRDWLRDGSEQAMREHYDAIWVYGSRVVYDVAANYALPPEVTAKLRYTGYVDRLPADPDTTAPPSDGKAHLLSGLGLPPGRLALCLLGGGEDGAFLAEAFAGADLPQDTSGVVVTGPFMPPAARAQLRHRAASRPRLRVLDSYATPHELLCHADLVVTMGGYNTLSEILSYDKPALVVPRVVPRREQLIRASRLSELGLVEMLDPSRLTSARVSEWLCRPGERPRAGARGVIDFGGRERLPALLRELLDRAAVSPAASSLALSPPITGGTPHVLR